jgi:SAM-dependent methyltransferase
VTERSAGPYRILSKAGVYELVQAVFGARRGRRALAQKIAARPGDRVLDIGAGPAAILEHLPKVDYVSYEPNSLYVKEAIRRYGARGEFHSGYFDAAAAASQQPFDIVLIIAVLHHLSDEQVTELLALVASVLKPGGRLITLDNCLIPRQSPIARVLVSLDRGRHVRSPEGYIALARSRFRGVAGEIVHRRFPPYTLWIMTLTAAHPVIDNEP